MLIASNAAAILDDRDEQQSFVLIGRQPRIVEHAPRLTREERRRRASRGSRAGRLGPRRTVDATARRPWRSSPGHQFKLLDALLRAADREPPDELDIWTARALEAFRRGMPEGRLEGAAAALVAMSWTTSTPMDAEDRRRSDRVYRAVRAAPKVLVCAHFDGLPADCLGYVFAYAHGKPAANANAIVLHALTHAGARSRSVSPPGDRPVGCGGCS